MTLAQCNQKHQYRRNIALLSMLTHIYILGFVHLLYFEFLEQRSETSTIIPKFSSFSPFVPTS